MHITTQTFHALHLTFRDAKEIDSSIDALLEQHDAVDLREFPVLANLFGAIADIADQTGGVQQVPERHEEHLMFDQAEPEAGPDAES